MNFMTTMETVTVTEIEMIHKTERRDDEGDDEYGNKSNNNGVNYKKDMVNDARAWEFLTDINFCTCGLSLSFDKWFTFLSLRDNKKVC